MKKNILLLFLLISIGISGQSLLIFGGRNHDVYLGCLTCNDYNSESIWNSYSKYGNNYNSNSIWNDCGNYGSDYSDYSPWNERANYPPVVVDSDGNFYGYLTRNKYNNKRADFKTALIMYEYYDLIRDNVDQWYKKIFESNN